MYKLPKRFERLAPYQPVTGDFSVRLDANESFIALPAELRDELAASVATLDFNRYPDPACRRLCNAFGQYYGVDGALAVAGNGSDELIGLIIAYLVGEDDCVCTVAPDFSMYSFYAGLAGARLELFDKEPNALELNAEALIDFCRAKNARLLILSNPCNPTSLAASRADIVRIIDALDDCLVVVDEAYMDFAEGSVIDMAGERDNLIVLKTCSKALGMAAVRLGFAVASPRITAALMAVKSPYNVNSMTQAAGELIFAHPDYLAQCAASIKQSRGELYGAMLTLAAEHSAIESVCDTQANFVFVKTRLARSLFEGAAREGVALRLMGGYLRITAGSAEENSRVTALLARLLSGEVAL